MNKSKKATRHTASKATMFILVCLSTIITIWLILPAVTTTQREKMQDQLAEELGVNILDFPDPSAFPSGYFNAVLRTGMPITEVHKIVKGYENVIHCDNNSEIYYYLSTELEDTERFKLIYDNEQKYVSLEGEDADSRTISTDGCGPGLINE